MTCIQHGSRGVECGPECARLTSIHRRTRYRFLHQAGGRYYWRRLGPIADMPGSEEIVSCSVAWFWRREAVAA